jgi:uncharacterized Zn finger protein
VKTLCVFGTIVRAPVCPKCGKDEDVIVRMRGDGWVYHCKKCVHDLSYNDIWGSD